MDEINKDLLPIRLTIVMIREKLTFLDDLEQYRQLLSKYFRCDYLIEDIKQSLYKLEEAYIVKEADKENVRDNPEDYSLE